MVLVWVNTKFSHRWGRAGLAAPAAAASERSESSRSAWGWGHTRRGALAYVLPPNVRFATSARGDFSSTARRTLVWVDRQGREEAIAAPPRNYIYARLSPDGTRIALDIQDDNRDVWVWDLARGTLTRLTFDPSPDRSPVWTPDGQRSIFSSDRDGPANLFWQAANGIGNAERLTESTKVQFAQTVSPDGRRLVFGENNTDLMMLGLNDGRRASIAPGSTWRAGTPTQIVEGRSYSDFRVLVIAAGVSRTYDVSPDGRRFLMIKNSDADKPSTAPRTVVVQNWFEELERRVPTE